MKEPKSLFQLQMNLDETVNTALAKARDWVEESLKRNPNLNYGETIIVGFDHGKVRLIHSLSDISESHLETNQRGIQSFAFQTSEEVLPDDSTNSCEGGCRWRENGDLQLCGSTSGMGEHGSGSSSPQIP